MTKVAKHAKKTEKAVKLGEYCSGRQRTYYLSQKKRVFVVTKSGGKSYIPKPRLPPDLKQKLKLTI